MEVLTNGASPNPAFTREDICLCWDSPYDRNVATCEACIKPVLMLSHRFVYKKCTCDEPRASLLYGCEECFGWVADPDSPTMMRPESAIGFRRALETYTSLVEEGKGTAAIAQLLHKYHNALQQQVRDMGFEGLNSSIFDSLI
jgi:hypothetical protein